MTPPSATAQTAEADVVTTPATQPAAKKSAVRTGPRPLTWGKKTNVEIVFLWLFVVVPPLAVVAAIPLAWGWGVSWLDLALLAVFYVFTGLGVTVGFHRYLTHGSFKATKRWLHILLTLAGTMAIEGAPIRWVADHRRHHQFSDEENDPHSPWRFGESTWGLTKGFVWAHMGWLFSRENTNAKRFAPDLIADKDVRFIQRKFVWVLAFTLLAPTAIGGLLTMSWQGALTAYFWAGLVRIALVHHVTWAVNSVCHIVGEKTFESKDRSRNFWPLAIPSFGESWHNLHHADPTCARHGVLPGQIDISARVIWLFEKAGWVSNVRWPKPDRIAAKRVDAQDRLAA